MGIEKQFWHLHEDHEYSTERRMNKMEVKRRYGLVSSCDECNQHINDNDGHDCVICEKGWHANCIPNSPDAINHPYHPYHPLKLIVNGPLDYSNEKCITCQENLKSFFYHCSLCDFKIHVRCTKNPPPPVIDEPKCHMHPLFLMARDDLFTCNGCGANGTQCPYVCPPCGLMFHQECIKLPHLININRHDHRISHIRSLDFGNWICVICRQKIDWRYGAYSCSKKCLNYVVHSKCATRKDVWDGIELESVPEEDEDVCPFKVIEEGVINHFSHDEHNLKLNKNVIDDDVIIRCEACIHPIYSENHYSCLKCDFILHETCANLPLKKRHGLYPKMLSLIPRKGINESFFQCHACETPSNGFRYECDEISLDVRCASISQYTDYECHPHTLFLTTLDKSICGGCNQTKDHVLHCVECEFTLCFICVTIPRKIKHKCDDHFLSLRYGENTKDKYWCEICETILDPQSWFYTCDDCGVVCHKVCMLGECPNAKSGVLMVLGQRNKAEMVSNTLIVRPKCVSCGSRCHLPLIFKVFCKDIDGGCCCNSNCFAETLNKNFFTDVE